MLTLPLLWHSASHKKERVPPALVARGAAFDADVWHNAVVLVDKPDGWSSSNVCSKLRGVMRVKKVRPRACSRLAAWRHWRAAPTPTCCLVQFLLQHHPVLWLRSRGRLLGAQGHSEEHGNLHACMTPAKEPYQHATALAHPVPATILCGHDKCKPCSAHQRLASTGRAAPQIGHAGTLDPRATGLLILCTGAATKGIEAHVLADKEYTGAPWRQRTKQLWACMPAAH